jgi:hypothetical protein
VGDNPIRLRLEVEWVAFLLTTRGIGHRLHGNAIRSERVTIFTLQLDQSLWPFQAGLPRVGTLAKVFVVGKGDGRMILL